jgi:predicted RecA/RadA family phage recombinase
MINFVHEGKRLTLTAPYAVSTGGGCKVGNVFGVASATYASGALGEFLTAGVFDLAKDTSTFAPGDLVYWNDSTQAATSTVSTNLLIGAAELNNPDGTSALGGASGDATVRVKLFGVPGFSGQVNGVKVAHALFDVAAGDSGSIATTTPANSDTIPKDAVVFGGVINSTVAVAASGGTATVAVGTVAGSSTTSILAATNKTSFTTDAVLVPSCVATPFKMTAAGKIDVTVAAFAIQAGQIEIWVLYTLASND